MEKERASNNGVGRDNIVREHHREFVVRSAAAVATTTTTTTSDTTRQPTTTTDFVLQWGNRKRLRCMKVQGGAKDNPAHNNNNKTTARVDRRVVRSDHNDNNSNHNHHDSLSFKPNHHHHHNGGGYLNLRHRPSSPPFPHHNRVLRNSENPSAMRGQSNGGTALRNLSSPEKKGASSGLHQRNGSNHQHNDGGSNNNKELAWSEQEGKKGDGGWGSSSGGSGDGALPVVWPPKFVIALTNKEKEEDFIIFKGSKLPQRPKKRAKMVQRTVNLVSPGSWLCDLTLERYEVREKKISKKRPRGLKAMGNMDSDSE